MEKKKLHGLIPILLLLVALGFSPNMWAANFTSTGSGTWATVVGATTSADNVTILPGHVVVLDATTECNSLVVNGTLNADVAFLFTAGAVTVNTGGSLVAGATNTVGVVVLGNLTNNAGTVNLADGLVTVNGTIVNAGTGIFTTNNATVLTLAGASAVNLPTAIKVLGKLDMTNKSGSVYQRDTLHIETALIVGPSAFYYVGNNGINVAGTTDIFGAFYGNTNDATKDYYRNFVGAVVVGDLVTGAPGVLNLSGSRVAATFGATLTLDANSSLNLYANKTTITGVIAGENGKSGSINAAGTKLTLTAAADFSAATVPVLNTNNNTTLILGAAAFTFSSSMVELGNIYGAATTIGLNNNLKIYKNYALDSTLIAPATGVLTFSGFKLEVNGTYNSSGADVCVGSELIFNGPVLGWATAGDVGLKLTFAGTGAIVANATLANVLELNMLRSNQTLALGVALAVATGGKINIQNGTVDALTFAITDVAGNNTVVGPTGTLLLKDAAQTFLGTVEGSGKIDIAPIAAQTYTFSGPYTFSGNLVTNDFTTLVFDTDLSNVSLNSSVTNLDILTYDRTSNLVLNNNLTLKGASLATGGSTTTTIANITAATKTFAVPTDLVVLTDISGLVSILNGATLSAGALGNDGSGLIAAQTAATNAAASLKTAMQTLDAASTALAAELVTVSTNATVVANEGLAGTSATGSIGAPAINLLTAYNQALAVANNALTTYSAAIVTYTAAYTTYVGTATVTGTEITDLDAAVTTTNTTALTTYETDATTSSTAAVTDQGTYTTGVQGIGLPSTVIINGNSLTTIAVFTPLNTIDASNSKLIHNAAATYGDNLLITNDKTDITMADALVTGATDKGISMLRNLTLNAAAATYAQTSDMTYYGNITSATAAAGFVMGAFNTIVYGSISASDAGLVDLTGDATKIITVYGDMSIGSIASTPGIITTGVTTNLVVAGTGHQLQLPKPAIAPGLFLSLTINRPEGVRMHSDVTFGDGSGILALNLAQGALDLNGYNAIIATADHIQEAVGIVVKNTGAYYVGSIVLPATATSAKGALQYTNTALVDLIASGIGIGPKTNIAGIAGTVVQRYPKVVPVLGVGLSVGRVYTTAASIVATDYVEFIYDNVELNSPASGLDVYYTAGAYYHGPIGVYSQPDILKVKNVPGLEKGSIQIADFQGVLRPSTGVIPGANALFAFAGIAADGGEMKYFTNGKGNNLWNEDLNWNPTGVPNKTDQAVVDGFRVILKGEGGNFYCKDLMLIGRETEIVPYESTTGDKVNLYVLGRIDMTSTGSGDDLNVASIEGIGNKGRINLFIGDGVATNVKSTINAPGNYTEKCAIWVNDLTVEQATLTIPNGSGIQVSGNINLNNGAQVTGLGDVVLSGAGGTIGQTINLSQTATAKFGNLDLKDYAQVATKASFIVNGTMNVQNGSNFIASAPSLITFPTVGTVTPIVTWNVEGATGLTFNSVNVGATTAAAAAAAVAIPVIAPVGNITVNGDFTKIGNNQFTDKNTITFAGISEIRNGSKDATWNGTLVSKTDMLNFWNLIVAPTKIVTTAADFVVKNMIDVQTNASFKAAAGTIYTGASTTTLAAIDAAPIVTIKNASDKTLEFNNLYCMQNTVTSDSWKIGGNMVVGDPTNGKTFTADNGKITFISSVEKSIELANAASKAQFFGLAVAEGAKLKFGNETTPVCDITISNNATYQEGAGLFLANTATLHPQIAANKVIFSANNVQAGYPKTIEVADDAILQIGVLQIYALPNNEVTTASSFEISGTGADASAPYFNMGAGGSFVATAGTILFTGATPEIVSLSPATTIFNNVKAVGQTKLALNTGDILTVRGDITIDDLAEFKADAGNALVIFDGAATQHITGTSSIPNPAQFVNINLNKTNATDRVILERDIILSGTGTLVLTNGILDLNDKMLTVGTNLTRHNGVIDGNKGTYLVNIGHQTPLLEDQYFMIDGLPTLYNLTVNTNHETLNDLTVNGTLYLAVNTLTVGTGFSVYNPFKLILNGDLTRNNGTLAGDNAASRLVLQGEGSANLSNQVYSAATAFGLEVARQESLGGILTMGTGANLRVNTGVNTFVVGGNTLTLSNPAGITMVSGSIDATGSQATVNFVDLPEIPANVFYRSEIGRLVAQGASTTTNCGTIKNILVLRGNLEITSNLDFAGNIIQTNSNILTFAPTMVFAKTFGADKYVYGNLNRLVTNTVPQVYPIGSDNCGTYNPMTLQFATEGTGVSQEILASSSKEDPTYGRGGDPDAAVNVYWNVTPSDVSMRGKLNAKFEWNTDLNISNPSLANAAFPAKWTGVKWYDYRDSLDNYSGYSTGQATISMKTNSYPVQSVADLNGVWAIFNAKANNNASKDSAISTTMNKLAIISITPSPAIAENPFKVQVQLQNQYGQPIKVNIPLEIELTVEQVGNGAAYGAVNLPMTIKANTTTILFPSVLIDKEGVDYQLKARVVTNNEWLPAVSEAFSVLPAAPSTSASDIYFENTTPTSTTVKWNTNAVDNVMVIAKAVSMLDTTGRDYPVNSVTYVPNTIFGAGSSIGDATVIAKGDKDLNSINVTGLLPNTKYFFYIYQYSGVEGNENYLASMPGMVVTPGTVDDDITLGPDDTRKTSKTIGTNAPVTGTIRVEGDEDWFNFMITSAAPNLRVKLYNLAGDYSVEVYDFTGRRIRRSTLNGLVNEAQVANDLPAGTYTVRVLATDGSSYLKAGDEYKLIVNTFGSEIFAVTP